MLVEWGREVNEILKQLSRFDRNRWGFPLRALITFVAVSILTVAAHADDQAKTEKELRKINSMALDPAARPLVSETIAEFLKVPRTELVKARHAAKLSYGSIFLAYRLSPGDITLDKISAQLQAGKTVWEIGNEQHADWRQIASDTKKLNDRIEAAFYNFFRDGHPEDLRTASDGYEAAKDSIPADQEGLTKQDIAAAQDTFARCFRRAHGGYASPEGGPDERDHTPPQAQGDPR